MEICADHCLKLNPNAKPELYTTLTLIETHHTKCQTIISVAIMHAMFESNNVSSCIKCTPPIGANGLTVDLDERHQNLPRQLRSFQKESQPWR
jgi:hypothetical protein